MTLLGIFVFTETSVVLRGLQQSHVARINVAWVEDRTEQRHPHENTPTHTHFCK